ncbi:type II toxin-antitoxin system HicA family toxin [Paenibacillus elgii]|uniref:type II toxin-antitoxin system HicA family toxin n=1 Tax=Paenibacillus elgii TaxID=189691 RepID=UPI00352706AA
MINFLRSKGFTLVGKGRHHKYSNGTYTVPIPIHNKDLKDGTLLAILKQTGHSKKDLLEWLGRN